MSGTSRGGPAGRLGRCGGGSGLARRRERRTRAGEGRAADPVSEADEDTERAIMARIRSGRPNMTVLVVSHRPSALVTADRRVEIESGRLKGSGRG